MTTDILLSVQAFPEKFDDLETYSKTLTTPDGDLTFDKIAVEVMGKPKNVQLREVTNFVFKRHSSLNLEEVRLQKIETFARKRAVQFLALAKRRTSKKKKGR